MSSGTSERPITVYGAIAANAVIAVSKFTAGLISGSSAMLSEGIHSVVDTGNELLLLLGIHRSKKPADELHPFGYGKELYFMGWKNSWGRPREGLRCASDDFHELKRGSIAIWYSAIWLEPQVEERENDGYSCRC